ncbi:hypothetical protein [Providencia stuartii]|uniref:hypothetical protein n=2 Tax=Morganellaceae TaxID=1903414 RepID=UPI00073B54BB|nr:hypothetical protein [Providencia stuartii]KSX94699.1 hypothetical protein APT95_01110 [Providencia stuartii]MDT2079367.1 hypothetical protein [Providencia stuartii]HEM6869892.1 hypothetical protein [Providencia stuartii]HEM7173794.1 hypothetical protein [Providencia stuartii]
MMQKLIIQVWVLVSLAVISNGYASNLELSTESKNFYESCLNMSEDLVFNGSYQYLCEFKGQKIAQIYTTYKANLYRQERLKNQLPKNNVEYQTENVEVIYKWLPPNKLRLTITYDNGIEQYIYYFIENKDSTIVFHEINTGY